MKLLKMIANTGLSVLALAAATGCNNGPNDKKATDSVSASAKPTPAHLSNTIVPNDIFT
jgi:hypothetical protein